MTTWPKPYIVSIALEGACSDRQFVNRTQLLDDLEDAIFAEDGPGVYLLGPRRFGKTSVIKRLAARLQGKRSFVYLDLQVELGSSVSKDDTLGAMIRAVFRKAVAASGRQLGDRELREVNSALDSAGRHPFQMGSFRRDALPILLRHFGTSPTTPDSSRLVFLLDELEVPLDRDPDVGEQLLEALTPFDEVEGRAPFLVIVCGRRLGHGNRRTLPSFGKAMASFDVDLLERQDLEELLVKPVADAYKWTQSARDRVGELTCGHPLFTAALGEAVRSGRRERYHDVEVLEVDQACERACQKAESWRDAWKQLSQLETLVAQSLALADHPMSVADIHARVKDRGVEPGQSIQVQVVGDVLHRLVEDYVAKRVGPSYEIAFPLLKHWIRRTCPSLPLSVGADHRDAALVDGRALEERGLALFRGGRFSEAARVLADALALEKSLEQAAAALIESLIREEKTEDAIEQAQGLGNLPTGTALLAKALCAHIERLWAAGEDAKLHADRLAAIDPDGFFAPPTKVLLARHHAQAWWSDLSNRSLVQRQRTVINLEERGLEYVRAALRESTRQMRSLIKAPSPDAASLSAALSTVPRLLDATSAQSAAQEDWQPCYAAAAALVQRAGRAKRDLDEHLTLAALAELLPMAAQAGPSAEPLQRLAERSATEDRLLAAVWTDASLVDQVLQIARGLDRRTAFTRICGAFSTAALMAGDVALDGYVCAMRILPSLGEAACSLADGPADQLELVDIATAAGLLLDRFAADPTLGEAIPASDPAWTAWRTLLEATARSAPELSMYAIRHLPGVIPSGSDHLDSERPATGAAAPRRTIGFDAIQTILGPGYEVEAPVPYRLKNVARTAVFAWNVRRGEKRLLVRAYDVSAAQGATADFLSYLWEGERRLLTTLSTRWEGRSLPRLHLARFSKDYDLLVLAAERIGKTTLRDKLDSGEIRKLRERAPRELWQCLLAVIEGLAALHRAGYIHRALRPDNIVVDDEKLAAGGTDWLRLTNFEWSLYLYDLGAGKATRMSARDRYLAPECIALEQPRSEEHHAGEGPASDRFALGLMLFECIVRPLTGELGPVPRDYGAREHGNWVGGLIGEVMDAVRKREVTTVESATICQLLEPDVMRRSSDLDSVRDEVGGLAISSQFGSQGSIAGLQLVSTLRPDTPESLRGFILQDVPDFAPFSSGDQKLWLEHELDGAEVRPNARPTAPLLLKGRKLNYTVEPMVFHGVRHSHIGWLKVAKREDRPVGKSIGTVSKVEVSNYESEMRLQPMLAKPNGWKEMFDVVERLHEGLSDAEQLFVQRVETTVELEKNSWKSQILPYERVAYVAGSRADEDDRVTIRAPGPKDTSQAATRTYGIDDQMTQAVDREQTWFELGLSSDPTAVFSPENRWMLVDTDDVKREVHLRRPHRDEVREPPEKGNVRPLTLAGSRALYERKMQVVQDLRHDAWLVRSVLSPETVFEDLCLADEPPIPDSKLKLDADKRELSAAIRNRFPLFVVVGPPGTGKTTLAADVVLHTLLAQPSSRILIVSQSHEPLNNLLLRVEEVLDDPAVRRRIGRRPDCIRLTSEERLDATRYGTAAVEVPRRYHPSAVATKQIEAAARADLSKFHLDVQLLWRDAINKHAMHGLSRSLEQRLTQSASLVYATANDRRLHAIRPGSFDLVIFEEAARAFPVDLLAPMRLSRRWLLIGDDQQLAPFGQEAIDAELKTFLYEYKARKGDGARGFDVAEEETTMSRLLRFFSFLHGKASQADRRRTLPSPSSSPGADPARPSVVSGLAGKLLTQWRMHPVIGSFVSECFYRGKLASGEPEDLAKRLRHGLVEPRVVKDQRIVWLDMPTVDEMWLAGDHGGYGGGWENGLEARVVLSFLRQLFNGPGFRANSKLAVISPYRAQVGAIKRLFNDRDHPFGVPLEQYLQTTDSFQGKQAEVVVVSLVRNNSGRPAPGEPDRDPVLRIRSGLGFLDSRQRSTVIFSRAERLLVLVGCLGHFSRPEFSNTSMAEVASWIRRKADDPKSGVTVAQGLDFVDKHHLRDQEEYRRKALNRAAARKLSRSNRPAGGSTDV